jgi:hypothetical protein
MTLTESVPPTGQRRGPRRALIAAAALLVAAGLTMIPGIASADIPPTPAGYHLVFSDDFTGANGAGVDTSKWQFATGHGYPGGAGNWGTGEVENMTSNNANAHLNGDG